MSEQQYCLGVAWLTELPPATAYRDDPDRPMQGYYMLSGAEDGLRITVQMDNCRRLSPQEPGGSHVYEAVLVQDNEGEVDAGGFNGGDAGSSSAIFLIPNSMPRTIASTRVDLMRHDGTREPILQGQVVWLQGPVGQHPGEWVQPGADRAEALRPVAGGSGPDPGGTGAGVAERAAPEPEVQTVAEPDPVAVPEGNAPPETEHWDPIGDPAPEQALPGCFDPAPGPEPSVSVAFSAAEDAGPDAPPPATTDPQPDEAQPAMAPPAAAAPVTPARVLFERLHHGAFRSGGYALLDRVSGSVEVTVRGLPSPAVIGGKYTIYKLWLGLEGARTYLPVGVCPKLLADTYRLSAHGLPLGKYDTLLITAEEYPSGGFPVGPKILSAAF